MKNWQLDKPEDIEKRSFEIIYDELATQYSSGTARFDEKMMAVLIRIIHTTADFCWVDSLRWSPDALSAAVSALRGGASIVTDTRMAEAGIDKARLAKFGGSTLCYMADADVCEAAKKNGTTRAAASMDKAAQNAGDRGLIFAIGNAPTALGRLVSLAQEGRVTPRLVIGVPVGFVNVIESKDLLLKPATPPFPYITAEGRKGGSTVAVAVCNALLRIAEEA
jgi:precorrin-8X/cobalt-precorrin-8 methylmutase